MAREHARQKALGIKDAGEKGEWRAWAKFLELSFPEYRQTNTKVEINTAAQAGEMQIVCDEATRKAMIAPRERFLGNDPLPAPEPKHLKRWQADCDNGSAG